MPPRAILVILCLAATCESWRPRTSFDRFENNRRRRSVEGGGTRPPSVGASGSVASDLNLNGKAYTLAQAGSQQQTKTENASADSGRRSNEKIEILESEVRAGDVLYEHSSSFVVGGRHHHCPAISGAPRGEDAEEGGLVDPAFISSDGGNCGPIGEGFHIVKVLHVDDKPQRLFHLALYEATRTLPQTPEELNCLAKVIQHAPVSRLGPKGFLFNSPVNDEEIESFLVYLGEAGSMETRRNYLRKYHREINNLLRHEHQHHDISSEERDAAIRKYTHIVTMFPSYWEALDNRALLKMEKSDWHGAIRDFEASLSIEPRGFKALFSTGECHYKLRRWEEARRWFERAHAVASEDDDPGHVAVARRFLRDVEARLQRRARATSDTNRSSVSSSSPSLSSSAQASQAVHRNLRKGRKTRGRHACVDH